MNILVVFETLAIGVLGLLVAGLLRSHAEILRRLHQLGVGYGEEIGPDDRGSTTRVTIGDSAQAAHPVRAAMVLGRSPAGDALSVSVDRPGESTLLLFVTSGCHRCGRWWDALISGAHHRLDARVVVVGRDPDEESPAELAGRAPEDLTVVMSSRAWEDYSVPGSPYAVFIGSDGKVSGEGTAATWDQLLSLVTQAASDGAQTPTARDGRSREARADGELAAAGILPGDPSLYPPPPE